MSNVVFNPFTGTLDFQGEGGGGGPSTGAITGVTDTATIDLTKSGLTLSADVVAGSIGNTELATGIDATKLADGSVSNTEYQYLANVTGDLQSQLNAIRLDTADAVTAVSDTARIDLSISSQTLSAELVLGSITDEYVASGISADKIADGSVTDVEYQYLANVTGDIQAQISALDLQAEEAITGVNDSATIDLTLTSKEVSADLVTGSVTDIYIASGISASKIADGTVSDTEYQYLANVSGDIQSQINARILLTEKGVASGVATLDGSGKVPLQQLPSALMEYKGAWDASTNTPSLVTGVGDLGDVYRVSVSGVQDIGEGPTTFFIGDFAIYDGSIWQRSPAADGVISVNGFSGAVTLDSDDIDEGTTNLYFTDERAIAAVTGTLTSSSTVELTYAPTSITASVVDGSITNVQLASGLNVTAFADGSVDNTEFQHLGGVSGAIQSQLNSKLEALSATGLGIDLYVGKNGPTGIIKSLVEGVGISLTDSGSDITIAATAVDFITSVTGSAQIDLAVASGVLSADLVTGSVQDAFLASGIDASKIADGTVSNTEYQFLAGVSGSIQVQLNDKLENLASTGSGLSLYDREESNTAYIKSVTGAGLVSVTELNGLITIAASAVEDTITGVSDTATVELEIVDRELTASVVTGSITDDYIASGINTLKIASGLVDNTEFSYLDGVTGAIQTQLNSKLEEVASTGGGISLYADESNNIAYIKSLAASGIVSISESDGLITIEATQAPAFVTGVDDTARINTSVLDGVISSDLVTGSVTDEYVASGIDAAKIADGLVDNGTFNLLAGATGNIQNQLNTKLETLASSGVGISLYYGKTDVTGLIKGLVAGPGIELSEDAVDITISATAADFISAVSDSATIDLTVASGDLSASLVTGSVTDVYVASGIDALKISDGSVDNAAYAQLSGATANIQSQLNDKIENAGTSGVGIDLYVGKTDTTAIFKGLVEGSGISLLDDGFDVTISSTATQFVSSVTDSARIDLTVTTGQLSADLVLGSVDDFFLASGINANKIADGSVGNTEFQYLAAATSNIQLQLDNRILVSEKAAPSGVATLDGAGKVPISQLPAAVMEYKGAWNAFTNTPTLATGVGDLGDLYRVSVSGVQDIGEGSTTFFVGDFVIYNGSIWQRSPASDSVISVNGFSGAVTLDTDDIDEGTANFYFTSSRALEAVTGALADTSSIELNYAPTSITADLKLSASGPDSGFVPVDLDVVSNGLRAQLAPSSLYTDLDARYLNTSGVSGDISYATGVLANNQPTGTNIAGLAFNNSLVRSAEVLYSIEIDATANLYEQGELRLIQRDSDWTISRDSTGDDSLVTFDITNAGQVTYSTPNYSGFVSGVIKYRARVTNV